MIDIFLMTLKSNLLQEKDIFSENQIASLIGYFECTSFTSREVCFEISIIGVFFFTNYYLGSY